MINDDDDNVERYDDDDGVRRSDSDDDARDKEDQPPKVDRKIYSLMYILI